jgi:hypothetical protein
MTVRHIFVWSVKDGFDGQEVLNTLATLEGEVPGVREWTIGQHAGESPNSSTGRWDYALTCDFESFAALNAYQNDPRHLALVNEISAAYGDWMVLDYELS